MHIKILTDDTEIELEIYNNSKKALSVQQIINSVAKKHMIGKILVNPGQLQPDETKVYKFHSLEVNLKRKKVESEVESEEVTPLPKEKNVRTRKNR